MNGITHKQARRYMFAQMDGLLTTPERHALQTHLDSCPACRAEADAFSALTVRLQAELHTRWDAHDGPSKHMLQHVQSQTRRIQMQKRIDMAFNLFGGAVTIAVLAFLAISVISQFQKKSTATASETQVPNVTSPVSEQSSSIATNKFNGEWIAFITAVDQSLTSESPKTDVFMIRPDGSGLVNLTNFPATYYDLQWSPNGQHLLFMREDVSLNKVHIMRSYAGSNGADVITRPVTDPDHYGYSWSPKSDKIVFADSSSGNYEIFTEYADGRNDPKLKQLTNDPGQDVGFVWSPDGSQIAFQRLDGERLSVYIMNEDGSNQREVAHGSGKVKLRWSLDGRSIYASSTKSNWLECEACASKPAIYHIDLTGKSVRQVYAEKTTSKVQAWYLYDTPQNMLYFMRIDPPAFLEFWGTWMQADGNSVHEIGRMDPQQTCKTTTGNSLNEHISPNERFSVISNYCAGGFDLYLADRETSDPEKKLVHLLRLPSDTYGQGGNNDTLPMLWSPDGRWVIYDNGQAALYLLNIERAMQDPTIEPALLFRSGSYSVFEAAWQPALTNNVTDQNPTPEPEKSEGLIAYVNDTNGDAEIYTMHADGSNPTNLTNHSGHDVNPIWSPDGKYILFESDRTGLNQIYSMNADGSNLTQLTDENADHAIGTQYGHTPNPWSPDGKQIVYSQSFSKEAGTNSLYVMDADGSNKTALTGEPGIYIFLGWSPDGKKIVYQDQQFENRIRIVDNHGANYLDGPLFEGDKSRRYSQIHWETPEQFIVIGSNSEQSTWGPWNLTRFFTTSDYTKYTSPILVTSNSPIVAIFDKIYVVEDQNSLSWFVYDGAPIPLSPWDFSKLCNSTNSLMKETFHFPSPDKQYDFVGLLCPEGNSYFFMMRTDGNEIHQVGKPLAQPLQVNAMEWSSDGKFVIATILNLKNESTELYRFDIQEMLNNPSASQTQITVDGAFKWGATWQPIINRNIVEEEPTPEPLTFTLTVNEAETLAGFDVLEPAYVPTGYTLEGVAYDAQTQKVGMKYISQQSEGVLFIYQQRGDFVHDPAIQAYVTPVPIGKVKAEYVRGAWLYDALTTTTPRWDPSAAFYSLTWHKDAITYSIEFIGGETITPLPLNEFVAIAESLK